MSNQIPRAEKVHHYFTYALFTLLFITVRRVANGEMSAASELAQAGSMVAALLVVFKAMSLYLLPAAKWIGQRIGKRLRTQQTEASES